MSTIPWLTPLVPARRFALRARLPALALAPRGRAAGLAIFLAYPTYPAYDSLYSLLWAQELLDGVRARLRRLPHPTEHPLLLPVGLVLAPFGEAGARLFIALCFAGLIALVAAIYRLGRLAAGPVGGFVAAGLLLTRFNFGLLASKGYLDVPYCAFVAWAMALEAERPRARRRGVVAARPRGAAAPGGVAARRPLRAVARQRRCAQPGPGGAARAGGARAVDGARPRGHRQPAVLDPAHGRARGRAAAGDPARRDPAHDGVPARSRSSSCRCCCWPSSACCWRCAGGCGRSRCPPWSRWSRSAPT